MRTTVALLAALAAATAVSAADYPIAGDSLHLRAATPQSRRLRFRAANEPNVVPGALASPPTVAGATLQVVGRSSGDGDTGLLALPAAGWRAVGTPPNVKGYRFLDPAATAGIGKLLLRNGKMVIVGKGANLPYDLGHPQGGPVDVRLTVGADVLCARFSQFVHNDTGLLAGKNAAAPAGCAPPTCGDGTVDGGEECDDGGTTSGDGCSNGCQLENTQALCAGVPATSGTGLASVRVADGLARPLQVVAPRLDPGRLFIVEQGGRVLIMKDGVVLPQPFLDISAKVDAPCNTERGLLSLAFDPAYEQNGRFFVAYADQNRDTVIARYEASADPDVADPASAAILLTVDVVPLPIGNHAGGQLAFGPDGYLYVGLGDGGDVGDPFEYGQDDGTLHGKLLRLDVNGNGYTVPPTNPFVGPGAPLDEIWATGLRQPWRFSFDRATGDLYLGEVGQWLWEEIDYQPASSPGGENYGWDVFEGDGHCFEEDPECATPEPFRAPLHEYPHDEGCAVVGGFVYRGCAMPDLHGIYFYSDYCTAFVRSLEVVGGVAQNHQDHTAEVAPGGGLSIAEVTSFGEDARGELYLTEQGGCPAPSGEVWKLVPAP